MIMAKKTYIDSDKYTRSDYAHRDISQYIDKRKQKKHKKNYDIKYICVNGKYRKLKVPHDTEIEVPVDAPSLALLKEKIKQEKTDKKLRIKIQKASEKAEFEIRKAKLKEKRSQHKYRIGDRKEGRRIKTVTGMLRAMPYIMPQRCDALNTYADSFDITDTEKFCREKIKAGMKNFSILHILLASYVRVVSQRPGINRFVSGREIYSRHSIDVTMTVKKNMSIESPDTCIKVFFEPTDTIDDIYEKFNKVVEKSIGDNGDTGFDSLTGVLQKAPRFALRFFVWLLNILDYHGKLPLSLLDLSPFHGSMIITSMGSLGIKPIYHHIYNFGNLPVFLSYGMKRTVTVLDANGNPDRRKYLDFKAVTDERICDGYYYASAFKLMKRLVEHPEALDYPPEQVFEDIP